MKGEERYLGIYRDLVIINITTMMLIKLNWLGLDEPSNSWGTPRLHISHQKVFLPLGASNYIATSK